MNYHNITTDDMRNGEGLRVVLWVAGCEHHCKNCQNPVTWDPEGGLLFDVYAELELYAKLYRDYISGLTFSGGDPLHPANRYRVFEVAKYVKERIPGKTIWLYTGYLWEEVCDMPIMRYIDVLVDGKFVEELADVNHHWAGSTNQRVIDVQKSLELGCAIRHKEETDDGVLCGEPGTCQKGCN